MTRDTPTRLTSDPANDKNPVWTPDGRRIVFESDRMDKSTSNLYWQRSDGTGDAQRLTESRNPQRRASWHPSGTFLAFEELSPPTGFDLMILPMEGDEASGWKPGKPSAFLNSPSDEFEPVFSPDGRWLAYTSSETGRLEVYVRPFRGPGGKSQISTDGGTSPTWSRVKHELFYGTSNAQIMVAAYAAEGDSFRAEKPRLWSDGRFVEGRGFDLHPDGERFALAPAAQGPGGAKQGHVTFIFNFFDELRRIAPFKAQYTISDRSHASLRGRSSAIFGSGRHKLLVLKGDARRRHRFRRPRFLVSDIRGAGSGLHIDVQLKGCVVAE